MVCHKNYIIAHLSYVHLESNLKNRTDNAQKRKTAHLVANITFCKLEAEKHRYLTKTEFICNQKYT